eukprot:jgi/Hompol1/3897/HPOL_001658-RA
MAATIATTTKAKQRNRVLQTTTKDPLRNETKTIEVDEVESLFRAALSAPLSSADIQFLNKNGLGRIASILTRNEVDRGKRGIDELKRRCLLFMDLVMLAQSKFEVLFDKRLKSFVLRLVNKALHSPEMVAQAAEKMRDAGMVLTRSEWSDLLMLVFEINDRKTQNPSRYGTDAALRIVNLGLPLETQFYRTLLLRLQRERRLQQAEILFDQLLATERDPNILGVYYALMVRTRVACGDIDGAVQLDHRLMLHRWSPTLATLESLANTWLLAGKYDRFEHHYRSIRALGKFPSIKTYQTILARYTETRLSLIDPFITDLEKSGEVYNTRIYSQLIRIALLKKKPQLGLELYTEMIKKGNTPNSHTYNTMIQLHLSMDNMVAALGLFDEMSSSSTLKTDCITYTVFMTRYGQQGDFVEMRAWFDRMLQAGIKPTDTTFYTLIRYEGQAYLSRLPAILDEMKALEIPCTPLIYEGILRANLLSPDSTTNTIIAAYQEYLASNPNHKMAIFEILIDTLMQRGSTEHFERIFRDICNASVRLTPTVLGLVVRALGSVGNLELIKELQHYVISQRLSVDINYYNELLSVYTNLDAPAVCVTQLIAEMQRKSKLYNAATYHLLLQFFCTKATQLAATSSDNQHVTQAYQRTSANTHTLSPTTYEAILEILALAHDAQGVSRIFSDIKNLGIGITPTCGDLVVCAFAREHLWDLVLMTRRELDIVFASTRTNPAPQGSSSSTSRRVGGVSENVAEFVIRTALECGRDDVANEFRLAMTRGTERDAREPMASSRKHS